MVMKTQTLIRTAAAGCVMVAAMVSSGFTRCTIKPEWSHFRYSSVRQGQQFFESVLNKPANVSTLHTGWPSPFHASGATRFTSSPVVYNGKVYIGNSNGFFYAIDAATGT